MRKTNKKGFTIVELVIVIAVIAILAAVLIPTFAGIVSKANKNAALQEVRAAWTTYNAEALTDTDEATPVAKIYVEYDDKITVLIENGVVEVYDADDVTAATTTGYTQFWLDETEDGDTTLVDTDPDAAAEDPTT